MVSFERIIAGKLLLSFKPLLALLMAFLEWEVFFFGTASRNGGRSSSNDWSGGIDTLPSGKRYKARDPTKACLANGNRNVGKSVVSVKVAIAL